MPGKKCKSKGIQSKHGYQFHIFEDGSSTYTFEDEESVRERFFYPYLKPKMVVVDVGSAYGSYTLPALARGCKVIAINPPHEYIQEIKGNVGLNNGFEKNFKIYPYFADSKNKDDHIKLDTLLAGRKYHFLKIDVEGMELDVLHGAQKSIKRYKPILLVENHLFIDYSLEEKCIQFIESLNLGYKWQVSPYNQVSHTFYLLELFPSKREHTFL